MPTSLIPIGAENIPDRTLIDRPVRGEHPRYADRDTPEQQPVEEFLSKLDALFAFPEVEAVRWEQFTPYFNDGDACHFGIRDPSIKFVGVDDGGDHDDGFTDDAKSYPPDYWETHYDKWKFNQARWNPTLRQYVQTNDTPPEGKAPSDWTDQNVYVDGVLRLDIEAAWDAVREAIAGGAHTFTFLETFGDPAQVTATRDGFDVEFYDHD